MSDKTLIMALLLGGGALYVISKRRNSGPAPGTTGVQPSSETDPGYTKPGTQGSGNSTLMDALGGLGSLAGLGASIGKVASSGGGSTSANAAPLGGQSPGSPLWSADFDRRLEGSSSLSDPTSDGWNTGYSSWSTGADYNAKTDSYDLPSYEDKMDLGDYSLGDAPQSWDDL